MATQSTYKVTCDWCAKDITYGGETQQRNISVTDYERQFTPTDGPRIQTLMMVHPMRQKDFCNMVCLAAWSQDATREGYVAPPQKGENSDA